MHIELIDLQKYPDYPKVLPFIEAMKKFDIVSAIETLKSTIQKDVEQVDKEYWFHLVNTENESGYYSNWAYGDEEVPDEEDKPKGDWRYIKFQAHDVNISQQIKDMFAPYLAHLDNFPYEIEIHSISKGARIEDHVDKPGVAVNDSSNRNLVISLDYPKGVSVDQIGVHVDNKGFTPEAAPAFLFDSQYLHGAWNNTDTPWTFVVLYIPTELIDGESGER